jgi:hypothetical protein
MAVQNKQRTVIEFWTAENVPPIVIHWRMEVICFGNDSPGKVMPLLSGTNMLCIRNLCPLTPPLTLSCQNWRPVRIVRLDIQQIFLQHHNPWPYTFATAITEILRLDLGSPTIQRRLGSIRLPSLLETEETSERTSLLAGRWIQNSGENEVPSTRCTVLSWRTHETTWNLAEVCGPQRWLCWEVIVYNYRM